MVPIAFKPVCLFLALFALPQVLAIPGGALLGLRGSFQDESLNIHNAFRALHGVSPLTWSGNLATSAAQRAATCNTKKTGPFENVLQANTVTAAVNSWTSHSQTLEYVLILSKDTKEFGCATSDCPSGRLVVCKYRQQ